MKNLLNKIKLTINGSGGGGAPVPPPPVITQYPSVLAPPMMGQLNSITSFSYAEIIDLLSDGPIEGLVNKDGKKVYDENIFEGIYLNDTSIKETSNINSNKIDISFLKEKLKTHFNNKLLTLNSPSVTTLNYADFAGNVNFNYYNPNVPVGSSSVRITSYHPDDSILAFVNEKKLNTDSINLIKKIFDSTPISLEKPFLTKIIIPKFKFQLNTDSFTNYSSNEDGGNAPLKLYIPNLSNQIYFTIDNENLTSFNYFELPRSFVDNAISNDVSKNTFSKTLLSTNGNILNYEAFDVSIYIWSIYNFEIGMKNIDSILDKYLSSITVYQNLSSLYNYNLVESEFKNGSEFQSPLKHFVDVEIDTQYNQDLLGPFKLSNSIGAGGIQKLSSLENPAGNAPATNINELAETSDDIRSVKFWPVEYNAGGDPFLIKNAVINYSSFDRSSTTRSAQNAVPITHYIGNQNVEQVYVSLNIQQLFDVTNVDKVADNSSKGLDSNKRLKSDPSIPGTPTYSQLPGTNYTYYSDDYCTVFILEYRVYNGNTYVGRIIDGSTVSVEESLKNLCQLVTPGYSLLEQLCNSDSVWIKDGILKNGDIVRSNTTPYYSPCLTNYAVYNGSNCRVAAPTITYNGGPTYTLNPLTFISTAYNIESVDKALKTINNDGQIIYNFGLNTNECVVERRTDTYSNAFLDKINLSNAGGSNNSFVVSQLIILTPKSSQFILRKIVSIDIYSYVDFSKILNSTFTSSLPNFDTIEYINIKKFIIDPIIKNNLGTTAFKLLLIGLNKQYLDSKYQWWSLGKLTLSGLEFLLDNFLLSNNYVSFSLQNSIQVYDKSPISAFENIIKTFDNGRLLGVYSTYSIQSDSIANSSQPVVSTPTNFGAFTNSSKTNYDINFIYLLDINYTNVNSANEYVITYKIYGNNLIKPKNTLSTSQTLFGDNNIFANATQQIAAGTRLPTLVNLKVETGYETKGCENYIQDGEYNCYAFSIYGLSTNQAVIDLGRNCYDFVYSKRRTTLSQSILSNTYNLYYNNIYFAFLKATYSSPTLNTTSCYILQNKDLNILDFDVNVSGYTRSKDSDLYTLFTQFKDNLNLIKNYSEVNIQNINNIDFLNNYTSISNIKTNNSFIDNIINYNSIRLPVTLNSYSISSNASNYDTYSLVNSNTNESITLCLYNFMADGIEQLNVNKYAISAYTPKTFYTYLYLDNNKSSLKNNLFKLYPNDVFVYLNKNGNLNIKNNGSIGTATTDNFVTSISSTNYNTTYATLYSVQQQIGDNIITYERPNLNAVSINRNKSLIYTRSQGLTRYLSSTSTHEFWIKSNIITPNPIQILQYKEDGNKTFSIFLFNNNLRVITYNVTYGGTSFTEDIVTNFNLNQWYNVTMKVDASTRIKYFYVNGKRIYASSTSQLVPDININTITIGGGDLSFLNDDGDLFKITGISLTLHFDLKAVAVHFVNPLDLNNFVVPKLKLIDVNVLRWDGVTGTGTYTGGTAQELLYNAVYYAFIFNFGSTVSPFESTSSDYLLRFSTTQVKKDDTVLGNLLIYDSTNKTNLLKLINSQINNIMYVFYKKGILDTNTYLDFSSISLANKNSETINFYESSYQGVYISDQLNYKTDANYSSITTKNKGLFFSDVGGTLPTLAPTVKSKVPFSCQVIFWTYSQSLTPYVQSYNYWGQPYEQHAIVAEISPIAGKVVVGICWPSAANEWIEITKPLDSELGFDDTSAFFYGMGLNLKLGGVCQDNLIDYHSMTVRAGTNEFSPYGKSAILVDKPPINNTDPDKTILCQVLKCLKKEGNLTEDFYFTNYFANPSKSWSFAGVIAPNSLGLTIDMPTSSFPWDEQTVNGATYSEQWRRLLGGTSCSQQWVKLSSLYPSATYFFDQICTEQYTATLVNQSSYAAVYSPDNNGLIKLPPPKFDNSGKPIRRYVKVTRTSYESLSPLIGKSIQLQKITEIIPQKFSYPFSAIVGTKIDARAFSQIPNRTFDCKLKKVLVPSNYFPLDSNEEDIRYKVPQSNIAIYDGDWDGTFKLSWTNNPAWILLDMLVNKRYGLGNYIESNQVDIWELYKIARWCDCVSDEGYFVGVADSYGSIEPRYAFNAILQEKFNIFDMINQIASSFRGAVYYMNSLITFDCDRLKPPIGEFNNADVKDGLFSYTNHKKDEEFTAVDVAYVDSKDNFKPKIEYIEDSDGIRQRGILKKQLNAFGVTSRGQAIRAGKNFLYQTSKENTNVNFITDLKALLYKPGDLITINDELFNSNKNFGTVKSVTDIDTNSFKIIIDKVLDSNIYNTGEIKLFVPTTKPKYDDYYSKLQTFPNSININAMNFLLLLAPKANLVTADGLNKIVYFNQDSTNYYKYTDYLISLSVNNKNIIDNIKSYDGVATFNYKKINTNYTDIVGTQISLSSGLNFNFSYLNNKDLYGNYSQNGLWSLTFANCKDIFLLDTIKNENIKIQEPHSKYFWEYFDSGVYLQDIGVDEFGNRNYNKFYFDPKSNSKILDSTLLSIENLSDKNLIKNSAYNSNITYYTKIDILDFSKASIAYSDLIQSDKPSVDTFYINSFLIGESYTELILNKNSYKAIADNFTIKSSVSNNLDSIMPGSPYSLKILNKEERLFKIMSINENYINEYNILATQYNINKFDEIDENSSVDNLETTFNYLNALNTTIKTNTAGYLSAPIIDSLDRVLINDNNFLIIKWNPVPSNTSTMLIKYKIFIRTPSKQTENYMTEFTYSNLNKSLNKFIYQYPLVGMYELGTYTISISAYVAESKSVPNVVDTMYKFSPESKRSISVINY